MSSHRPIRKDSQVIIAVISALVITGSSINSHGYFDITKVVYGQPAPDQTSSNTTNSMITNHSAAATAANITSTSSSNSAAK